MDHYHMDDLPPDKDEWEDLPEINYIEIVGRIFVLRYGINGFAVGIAELDPGFYAYRPAMQRVLFRLYLAAALMQRIAENVASKYTEHLTAQSAQALSNEIGQAVRSSGVGDFLLKNRKKAVDLAAVFNVLAQNKGIIDTDKARKKHSNAIKTGTTKIAKDRKFIAFGEPYSAEREEQIEIFMEQPASEKIPSPKVTKIGEDLWKQWMRGCKANSDLYQSAVAFTGGAGIARKKRARGE